MTMRIFQKKSSERGVTLVELLVALAILAVALTPLLSIFLHALKMTDRAGKMTIANNLARDLTEEIRSRSFWDPDLAYNRESASEFWPAIKLERKSSDANNVNFRQPVGLEVGNITLPVSGKTVTSVADPYPTMSDKNRIEGFDDIDDYDGWCRGAECTECENGTANNGLCADNTPLEAYDGRQYDGTELPNYHGVFTRRARVYNIYPNVTTLYIGDLQVGYDQGGVRNVNKFQFYDLTESTFPTLTSHKDYGTASGRTALKVIEVTVEYSGSVAAPFHVKDTSLAVFPVSQ